MVLKNRRRLDGCGDHQCEFVLNQRAHSLASSKAGTTQHRNRCRVCGRARAYIRKFQMCRICFRGMALKGEIPGVVKASW